MSPEHRDPHQPQIVSDAFPRPAEQRVVPMSMPRVDTIPVVSPPRRQIEPQDTSPRASGVLESAPVASRIDTSALESTPVEPIATEEDQSDDGNRLSIFRFNRLALLTTGALLLILLLFGAGALFLSSKHNADKTPNALDYSQASNGNLSSAKPGQLSVNDAQKLTVNGELQVTNTLVLKPMSQPSAPQEGQLYFDQVTRAPYYYDGTQFISLAPQHGVTSLGGVNGVIGLGSGLVMNGGQLSISSAILQQIASSSSGNIGPYVASLQGQSGNVTLGAGSGININGTTISNGGVIGLAAGSPNLTITSDGNGHYTISAASASGITGSGTPGHIAKFDGASSVTDSSLTEAGTTLTYGGNFIVNAASGFSGNLVNLEVNGSSKLTVDQSGDTVQAGTLTVNGTGSSSIAGSLSVGTGLTVTTGGASVTGNSVINGTLSGLTGLTSGGTITFSGLTPGGVVHNNASGVLSTGPVQLGVDTTGNYVAQLGTLTGLTTTGNSGSGSTPTLSVTYGDIAGTAVQGNTTLTVSAGTGLNGGGSITLGSGGTLTLNVQYGSSAGTAVAGNTTLTCPTGTGNLQGGGNVVTLGAGGSCNNITISNSPTFTGTLTVQGSGGIVVGASGVDGTINLLNSSNANVTTLKSAAVGQSQTITIPDSGLASDEVCLVALGNCAGSGGGIVGSGTAGHLSKFNSATSITDSGLVESGSTLTYSGNVVIQGSSSLSLGTSNANTGGLTFNNSSNANTLTLQAGATGGNLTLTLPTAYGNDGDCLMTNSVGVLSFQACTGGSGGGVTSLDGQIGIVTLANSSGAGGVVTINNAKADASTKGIASFNATNFKDNGSGIINTIQDISTTSTPTFGGLTLSAPLSVASGGTGANNFTLNGILYGNGTSPIQATSAAADSVLATDSSNVPHLVQTLPMAVQGNITQTGALSSGSIVSGFGNISTGNLIGTTASLHGGTLSVGASNQFQVDGSGNAISTGTLAVQGAGGLTVGAVGTVPGVINFANSTNSNLGVLQAIAPTGTGNATYNLPSLIGGTSDDVCLKSLGNCAGSGGVIGGGGTLNHITKFSPDGSHIADSNLVESGTTLTYAGNLVVNAGSGFTGNLLNLEVNGSSKLSVDQNGSTIQAGTLTVNGTGASSIAGTLSVGTLGSNGTVSLCSNAGIISSCTTSGSGTQGWWTRSGTTLQPANAGDNVTTSGNISTTGTGGITSAGDFVANGAALFKDSSNSPTAFQVQNSGGGNLIVADTANSKVGINTGALALNTNLNVYNSQPSTTQTDFTQNLSRAGINFMTDYVQDAYTGGIFWSTQDNNPSSPKAGIYSQVTNSGSKLLFGTSSSYSAGLTNTALTLGYNGEAIFRNGLNTPTGFQIQDSTGAGLFTVDTTTGAALATSLFVDTLGSGGTTALCWNGSSQVSTCASTGSIGFWNRTGTTLQPATSGDSITTSGNISTSGTGTITSAGLLTGNGGLTVIGGTANINASGTGTTNIGNASGGPITMQSGSTIAITAGTSLNLTSTGSNAIGINPGGGSNTGVVLRPGTDSTNLFQIQNALTGATLMNVDSVNSNITLLGNDSGAVAPWQTASNALPAARNVATSVVANGYVYVIGGNNGAGAQSTVYYAKLNSDGSVGTWNTASNALPATVYQATSVAANGYVYVMGGVGSSAVYYAKLNSDGSVGTWNTASNALPGNRQQATSVVANGYVYVIGGSNGTIQSTVYYAKLNSDGSVGTWNTASNALPGVRSVASSVVANGYVYVIGGSSGTAQSTVYYAKLNSDGSVGTWNTASNALPGARVFATSVVANGYVYELGGSNSSFVPQSTVYYAKLNSDGSVGTWNTATNALPDARINANSVVSNGYIYELGGANGAGTVQTTVYYTSTPRLQVGGSLDLVGLQSGNIGDGDSQGLGSVGGNLTAGDTNIVGTLQVQGAANFSQSVAINGALNVGSDVTITTTSATAFQVQDASGAGVLSVDTANKRVGVGTSTPTTALEVVGDITSKGTAWTIRASASDSIWNSVTYGNGLFVAVASGGQVMTSTDGVNWTSRTGVSSGWSSVTYGNGLFVAVSTSGTGNRVMTSPDGINWTIRTSAADDSWRSVAYGNGLFVAVGSAGAGSGVMTSPDGINWTSRTSAANNFWRSVTYGNGLFVAVSSTGPTNEVMTSPDGINWTGQTSAANSTWYSVTYGNGLFVAVSTGGLVMTSPDGINWTSRTAAASNAWDTVTYGNGLFVVAGASGTGNRVMTSPNGINWTSRTSAADNIWNSVTYGNGIFVAVAGSGTGNRVMTSGKTEITVPSPNNTYQGGITVHGSTQFISDTNSTTAFQVQNANGVNTLSVDTSNGRVQVGVNGTPTGQLFVSGSAPASANGSVTASTGGLQDVSVQGSYAYVIDYGNSLLKVIDVSNPASPAVVGSVSTSAAPQTMTVVGRYAYVGEDTAHKLEIFDISNPSSPALTGSVDITNGALSIAVSGKYAFVGAGGAVKVIDISNPATPSIVSSFSISTPLSMFVAGTYLYAVNNATTGTFSVINISNPASLSTVGSVTTSGQSSCSSGSILGSDNVYVSGKYAYVTVCSTNTVKIFDISNPASPTAVGSGISTGSSTGPVAVNVQGRYAYAALYNSNQIAIYDVSTPSSPSLVGTTSNGASSGPLAMSVQGRYAYAADWLDKKLNVYDLGGAYVQQLEVGGISGSNLAVNGNGSITGDLNLQGSIHVGQNAQIDGNLGVGGSALFQSKTNSTTAFQIQNSSGTALLTADTTTNTLTVSTLVVSGNLTVNGHIITGGTTPTRTVGATNTTTGGTGATCTVAGTDTSGVITFVAGTGTTISTTGTICTITFSNAFGATPRVVLGAGDTNGAKSDPYVTSVGTGSFAVANSFNLTQGQTYTFYYIATQ